MNSYRLLRNPELYGDDLAEGDVVELDLTHAEEERQLAQGLLEIVPRPYLVVGTSRVFETDPGATFEAALSVERERLLTVGGHIERADPAPAKQTTRSRKKG